LGIVRFALKFPHTFYVVDDADLAFYVVTTLILRLGLTAAREYVGATSAAEAIRANPPAVHPGTTLASHA
jgi:hypothetical protein